MPPIEILDTDLFLVQRDNQTHKVTASDLYITGAKPINPVPDEISISPPTTGNGTEGDPYIMTSPQCEYGKTINTDQQITFTNQRPGDLVVFTDLNASTNGDRYSQPVDIIEPSGIYTTNLLFIDTPKSSDPTSFIGTLTIGTTPIYFKWDVEVVSPVYAPIVDSVTLVATGTDEEKRFEDQSFASNIALTEGNPVSTKSIGYKVAGTLFENLETSEIVGETTEVIPGGWNSATAAEANTWYTVTYGAGKFVALSNNGTNRVMWSTDGIDWTPALAAGGNTWRGVVYGGDKFVAVSEDGTNRAMYSYDAITWTSATMPGDGAWQHVAYGNGVFVAVNQTGGTVRLAYSSDGITWTGNSSVGSNPVSTIAFGEGGGVPGQFVSVRGGGTNDVMRSPDGITWTTVTSGGAVAGNWSDLAYGNTSEGGRYVALSPYSATKIQWGTANGESWFPVSAPENSYWASVTFGDGKFVAVAVGPVGYSRTMYSTDAINWTTVEAAEDNDWYSVTYGAGKFVAVSYQGTNQVMWSLTGTPGYELPKLIFADNTDLDKFEPELTITQDSGGTPETSAITNVEPTNPLTPGFPATSPEGPAVSVENISYAGNAWFAVTNPGGYKALARSTDDGATWTNINLPIPSGYINPQIGSGSGNKPRVSYNATAPAGKQYVIGGWVETGSSPGCIWASGDGISWTAYVADGGTNNLSGCQGIVWDGSKFVAINQSQNTSQRSYISCSTTLATGSWGPPDGSPAPSSGSGQVSQLHYFKGRYFVKHSNNILVSSDLEANYWPAVSTADGGAMNTVLNIYEYNDTLVATSYSTAQSPIWYTTDGVNWYRGTDLNLPGGQVAMGYANDMWIAVACAYNTPIQMKSASSLTGTWSSAITSSTYLGKGANYAWSSPTGVMAIGFKNGATTVQYSVFVQTVEVQPTVLTLTNDTNLANLRVGDVVQGKDYSSGWSGLINPVGPEPYAGGTAASFDGDLNKYTAVESSAGNTTTEKEAIWNGSIAFSSTLNLQVYIEDYLGNIARIEVTGASGTLTKTGSGGGFGSWATGADWDISAVGSPLTEIKLTSVGGAGSGVSGVTADGVLLVNAEFKVTAIDGATPSITTDGGTWTNGETVTGPFIPAGTGTVGSVDTSANTITLSATGADRWLVTEPGYDETKKLNKTVVATKIVDNATAYLETNSNREVTGTSFAPVYYETFNTTDEITFNLNPGTGRTWDEELPDGTTIQACVYADNTTFGGGRSPETGTIDSNVLQPEAVFAVSDLFATKLYNGNNSTKNIKTGINNTGKSLVWFKERTGSQDHQLYDSVRGFNSLKSNETEAELDAKDLVSYNEDGVTIQNSTGWINGNSINYVLWNFRAAPKFFDIQTWTGDNTASRIIPHSLTTTPGFILTKKTIAPSQAWVCYHKELGTGKYLMLDRANEPGINDTWLDSVSATDFVTGTDNGLLNESGETYVAYLFADEPGLIKCGEFTTDGAGKVTVDCGFAPQWILTKPYVVSGDWKIFDNARGFDTSGYSTPILRPNSNQAESEIGNVIVSDTGFQFVGFGVNNEPHIYVAIAAPVVRNLTQAEVNATKLLFETTDHRRCKHMCDVTARAAELRANYEGQGYTTQQVNELLD